MTNEQRTDQAFDPREVWAVQHDDECMFCGDDHLRHTDGGVYCMSCGQLQEQP